MGMRLVTYILLFLSSLTLAVGDDDFFPSGGSGTAERNTVQTYDETQGDGMGVSNLILESSDHSEHHCPTQSQDCHNCHLGHCSFVLSHTALTLFSAVSHGIYPSERAYLDVNPPAPRKPPRLSHT